ncbi:hypothetical protein GGTG_14394 [Gaeumannomyces tritici R3-111a-1]|uniref:Uncharacterized protein n=1 Tax=Gaeumannomyces tritici (strain R3-111a-1) TaxID=644352 RepID=J3PLD0_GAET3|nr:hypothetical protein GGTG_14394 [Gaeumannomyces tritici R3-111a-1]EJT68028.1 hypothetical protein GGTG_14394 [Gaeumannomyces tritici R3-111a-1]
MKPSLRRGPPYMEAVIPRPLLAARDEWARRHPPPPRRAQPRRSNSPRYIVIDDDEDHRPPPSNYRDRSQQQAQPQPQQRATAWSFRPWAGDCFDLYEGSPYGLGSFRRRSGRDQQPPPRTPGAGPGSGQQGSEHARRGGGPPPSDATSSGSSRQRRQQQQEQQRPRPGAGGAFEGVDDYPLCKPKPGEYSVGTMVLLGTLRTQFDLPPAQRQAVVASFDVRGHLSFRVKTQNVYGVHIRDAMSPTTICSL